MDSSEKLEKLDLLWRRERDAHRERLAETTAGTTVAQREARGLALRDLDIIDREGAAGGRLRIWLQRQHRPELSSTLITAGDPVRLWKEHLDEPSALRGIVSAVRDDRLAVVVNDEPESVSGLRLDLDGDEATFEWGFRALREVRAAKASTPAGRLRELVYGNTVPSFANKATETPPFDGVLNASQLDAVVLALRAHDVALVHGPPGTGKTRTLVEVIRRAVAMGERVLACAPSNVAVDNLAEALVNAGVPIVRVGHPSRVSASLEAHTLDGLLAQSELFVLGQSWMRQAAELRRRASNRFQRAGRNTPEIREEFAEARRLVSEARQQIRNAQQQIMDRARVVCTTASSAASRTLRGESFDRVVLDEATQAVDPLALAALLRGSRWVLAGDPCQLPPTVIDADAARDGLGVSIFERLANRCPDAVAMLVVQHRMPEALMVFPSESMYAGRLEAAPSAAAHELAQLGATDDHERPGCLVFVDTAGKGWDEVRGAERAGMPDDLSTSNPGHAERAVLEVRRLLERGLSPSQVGLITPYRAQVVLLRGRLADEVRAGLEIHTVDGFQGREKEAIVVDLVRSNDDSQLGFLAELRRMNVAITRAKRFLLVLGDSATIGGNPYYAAFLDSVELYGSYLSAWTSDG